MGREYIACARKEVRPYVSKRGAKCAVMSCYVEEYQNDFRKAVADMAKVGRPPKYNTAEEMQAVIDAYFESCEGKPIMGDDGQPCMDKYGNVILIGAKPPTVTGLALALGFTSRLALLKYQGKREFVNTVTRAKSRIEEYAEGRLFDRDGQRGAEFTLRCNFRWSADEQKEDDEEETGIAELPAVMPTPPPPEDDESEGGGNG